MSESAYLDARQLSGCRHRLRLDVLAARAGLHAVEHPGARQRMDAAAAHRADVRDMLVEHAPDRWAVVDSALPAAERVAITLRACADRVDWIWGAVLPAEPDTGRRGGSEILLRDVDRGGYIPVIVVNHKVSDPRRPEPTDTPALTSGLWSWDPQPDMHRRVRGRPVDLLRLAHIARMLQRHGLASPALVGGIIGMTADHIVAHDLSRALADYDGRYADRIAVVRDELPTAPSRVPECRSCEWWSAAPRPGMLSCEQQLRSLRDVSLVATGARAEILRAAGAETVDDLAQWVGPPPEDWEWDDFADVAVAAKAWRLGVPLVRRAPTVRVRRADVEVDVDLESFGEHGAYLWGTLLDGVYRPFATWDPLPTADEARSFAEFWTWLMAVRAQAHATGKTFAAYCYTRAEDKWLLDSAQRFAGMPGIPTADEVRELVGSKEWVDMFAVVTENFICPHGKGLKKIAPAAGFAWRDPEAGGEASMGWYRAAVGYDGDPPDPGQRRRVLEYNEDDVRATATLREWMTRRADMDTPLAAEL